MSSKKKLINNKITVLITTFNDNEIENCLNSLANQTISNFKILLINDGGNDLENLLKRYDSSLDIRYINLSQNIGLTKCLNYGIDLIDTKYIARMDSDDYALPERFELQLSYLESKNYDLIGSSVVTTYRDLDFSMKVRHAFSDEDLIKKKASAFVPIAHPTFFGRTSLFKKIRYNENLIYSQDYDFIARALCLGYKIGNLNLPLLIYDCPYPKSNKKILTQMFISNIVSNEYIKSINSSTYSYKYIEKISIKINYIEKVLMNFRRYVFKRKSKFIRTFLFAIYLCFSIFSKTQLTFNLRNLREQI